MYTQLGFGTWFSLFISLASMDWKYTTEGLFFHFIISILTRWKKLHCFPAFRQTSKTNKQTSQNVRNSKVIWGQLKSESKSSVYTYARCVQFSPLFSDWRSLVSFLLFWYKSPKSSAVKWYLNKRRLCLYLVSSTHLWFLQSPPQLLYLGI